MVALVPGPRAAYASVEVIAGERTSSVPATMLGDVAPLLVARVFRPSESPSAYGLSPPRALLRFRRAGGGSVDVAIGAPTFDAHFTYVQRTGEPVVGLLAASVAGPLLALVGIASPPPR